MKAARAFVSTAVVCLAAILSTSCGSAALKPSPAGAAWHVLLPNNNPPLWQVHSFTFADSRHGWAVGVDDPTFVLRLFASVDGGHRWKRATGRIVSVPKQGEGSLPSSVDRLPVPEQVLSVDGSLLLTYLAESPSMPPMPKGTFTSGVLTSGDGGRTWTRILALPGPYSVLSVSASDPSHLWALCGLARSRNSKSDYLLQTVDGGRHWRPAPVGGFGAFGLGAPQAVFVDAGHAWSTARLAPDRSAFEVCLQSSVDGGRTWKQVSQPKPGVLGLPSFSAVDATHAWVGSNLGWPHRKATLYSTADGGKKWRPTTLSGQTVAAVYFADLKHGWVVVMDGNKSVIYGTKDGGKTWRKEYALPREGPDWSLRAAGGTLFASDGLMMLERPLAIAAR